MSEPEKDVHHCGAPLACFSQMPMTGWVWSIPYRGDVLLLETFIFPIAPAPAGRRQNIDGIRGSEETVAALPVPLYRWAWSPALMPPAGFLLHCGVLYWFDYALAVSRTRRHFLFPGIGGLQIGKKFGTEFPARLLLCWAVSSPRSIIETGAFSFRAGKTIISVRQALPVLFPVEHFGQALFSAGLGKNGIGLSESLEPSRRCRRGGVAPPRGQRGTSHRLNGGNDVFGGRQSPVQPAAGSWCPASWKSLAVIGVGVLWQACAG